MARINKKIGHRRTGRWHNESEKLNKERRHKFLNE